MTDDLTMQYRMEYCDAGLLNNHINLRYEEGYKIHSWQYMGDDRFYILFKRKK